MALFCGHQCYGNRYECSFTNGHKITYSRTLQPLKNYLCTTMEISLRERRRFNMKENYFAGTGKIVKLYLRRDRIVMPIWILLPVFLIISQISFIKAMPDWQMFLAELSESPVTSAILGPVVPLSIEGAHPMGERSSASFHSSYVRSWTYDDSIYPYGRSIWKK